MKCPVCGFDIFHRNFRFGFYCTVCGALGYLDRLLEYINEHKDEVNKLQVVIESLTKSLGEWVKISNNNSDIAVKYKKEIEELQKLKEAFWSMLK